MKTFLKLVIAAFLLAISPVARAQIFDNPCPSGTLPIIPTRTQVQATGHLNDTMCSDQNGNLIFQALNASLSASDTFTRANGPLGANWVNSSNTFTILTNAAVGSASSNFAYWADPAFVSNTQFSQATISIVHASDTAGPAVFISKTGDTLYACTEHTTTIFLTRRVAAVPTTLASSASTGTNGDVLRLEIDSSGNLTCYKNGVSTLTATNTVIKNGSPGISSLGSNGRMQNWSGGNLPVSAGASPSMKWNSVISVDGTQYTTCDTAVSAATLQAGLGTALVIVPSTYTGPDCTTVPTNVHVQVWYFNGTEAPSVQSGVYWNNTSATPIHAWLRLQDNDISPAGNSLGLYVVHRVTGNIPAASAMDAISPEMQIVGTLGTWGGGSVAQGSETVVNVASLGGTIPQATAEVAYVRTNAGSTTNVSNAYGLYAPALSVNGTGTITNSYGIVADVQTAGTSNNLSGWFKGATEFDAANSFICATANCANVLISGTATVNGSGILQITNTGGSGHTYKLGESFGTGRLSFRDTTQTGAPSWSLQQLSTTGGAEGIITHTNTGVRTYTFQDVSHTMLGGVYSSNGTEQTGKPHIVQDTATLAAGTVTITFTGAAVFTNATSYTCVADDDTAIGATRVLQNSGTSVTITGTGTDVIRYICVGN